MNVKRYFTIKEKQSNKVKYSNKVKNKLTYTNVSNHLFQLCCSKYPTEIIVTHGNHKSCRTEASCETGHNNNCLIFTLPMRYAIFVTIHNH